MKVQKEDALFEVISQLFVSSLWSLHILTVSVEVLTSSKVANFSPIRINCLWNLIVPYDDYTLIVHHSWMKSIDGN